MIYVCVTARDNAPTVGLVLWKIRQVFEDFPREYHLLVADDASTDGTAAVLAPYERALPMSLIRTDRPRGYAACLEHLLRRALELTDRPKRDCVATLPADFSVSPAVLPDLIRRLESGADLVVGEAALDTIPLMQRLVRRAAPWLLKPGLRLSGFRDVMSGAYAVRLVTLKACIRECAGSLLGTEGRCADAELVARAAAAARQISVAPITTTTPYAPALRRDGPLALALQLMRAGRSLSVPAPQAPLQRSS